MEGITRANPYLEEIIEIYDVHLQKHNGNRDKARAYLSRDDNEWIDQELMHCITDSRYFISNYYAVRTEDKGFQGLYPFWDSQEILDEEYNKLQHMNGNIRALVLKARQMGSTTYNCARLFHSTVFCEHINAIIVAQDEDVSGYVMGMYESALDFLPWWMQPRIKIKQTGSQINFDEKDDALRSVKPGLKTWIYADNARKPTGVGRSKTFGRALLTELAFWQNGSQLSKSLFPTMNTKDGFYVMESTANGRNDFWHQLWKRAEKGKVDWHPIFIPFYRRAQTYSLPIAKNELFTLTDEEKTQQAKVFREKGFLITNETFKWVRKTKEGFIAIDGDDLMFSQEYTSDPEESFQISAVTAFPRGVIKRWSLRTQNPLWVGEISYDWKAGKPHLSMRDVAPDEEVPYPEREDRLFIWERPLRNTKYSMGVDVSLGNDGGDYACIQVVKIPDGHEKNEQVACWHGYIHPEDLAAIVFAMAWYYNEALATVEVNNMGVLTNSKLVREYEYENIYRFTRMDRLKNFQTDIIGWWTDEKSKRALISKMSKCMLDNLLIIRDKNTMDEFNDFTSEGALGEGAHDDYVMALMIAVYCGSEMEVDPRKGKEAAATNANTFIIKDRFGTEIARTTSQNEADRLLKKHIGASSERIGGATANVIIGDKKYKVPADNQNIDFSPIHDKIGTAHRLHYDDEVPEEMITPEMIADAEALQDLESKSANGDSWKYA